MIPFRCVAFRLVHAESAATRRLPMAACRRCARRHREVAGAQPLRQHRADRPLDAVGDVRARKRIAEHHRDRQDRRQGIGLVLPCDVGRRAMYRLVETFRFASSDAEGSMPIDPASIDASSDRMSPKILPVTITSNCLGCGRAASPRCRRTCATARRRDSPCHFRDDLAPTG